MSLNPSRVYDFRLKAGLTQADVAHRLRARGHERVTERSIRRWESGDNTPHANIVPDLAAVLGVTIEKLYERSESGDDEDEEVPEPVRRLRAVASELAERDLDDLASELLSIAGQVARDGRPLTEGDRA